MKKSLLGGAMIIAAGGLISKVIGAVYRVPLTNLIGAEGMGLYQMVFPVYCALLTFSSTGLPTAISKMVSSGESPVACLKKSLVLFGCVGLAGSVIMCVLGGVLAKVQGNGDAWLSYALLSPSVVLVSVISCFRGYFQGKSSMTPTAVSQVVEQVVKALAGLVLCYYFRHNVALAAGLAALAVSISEVAALSYLVIHYLKGRKENGVIYSEDSGLYRRMLKIVLPVAATALLLPLGHVADSFIIINTVSRYSQNATSLFGIYSGSVAAIVGLPVSVAYGVAVASVPAVSRGGGEKEISKALRFTGFVAIPSAVFLFFFARQCVELLYGSMQEGEIRIATALLMADSVSVAVTSYLQTVNAVATAVGRQKFPVIALLVALAVRIALCAAFTAIPQIGIMGADLASVISLITALLICVRFVLPHGAVARACVDVGVISLWSIICVLGGFWLYKPIGGRAFFVVATLLTVAIYLLPAAIDGVKMKIKGQT